MLLPSKYFTDILLVGKERESTKEKFKNFNQSFDEVISRCKALKMEGDVRDVMVKEVVQVSAYKHTSLFVYDLAALAGRHHSACCTALISPVRQLTRHCAVYRAAI